MIAVPFPPPQFKIKKRGEAAFIFDTVRKRWVLLTEEEWVRQNMVAYFTACLFFPRVALAVEKALLVNGMKKRFDILVFDRYQQPKLMVECKAPGVSITDDVLQQALRYHIALPVDWIVLTNGNVTLAWQKINGRLVAQGELPMWNDL